MKKVSLILVVVLLSLAASVSAEREFIDSTGRTVIVPDEIEKVAVSGPMTQIFLFALCPEKFAGISSAWDETAAQYLPAEYYDLPLLGQLYGGKGELNLETLLASGAQPDQWQDSPASASARGLSRRKGVFRGRRSAWPEKQGRFLL